MISKSQSVLSPILSTRLSVLGATIPIWQSDTALAEILAELSDLPANLIVRASREIVVAAQFWWKPRSYFSLESFLANSMSEQKLLKRNPDYGWLLIFHTTGYVREAALNAIQTPPASPFFFAALAWRLNDWVEPVRQAATRCAERVLGLTNADIAAKSALYLLDRRFVWERWGDESNVLDAVFVRNDVVAALVTHLQKQATGPLASILNHALRYPNIDPHLPRLATQAVQLSVRCLAYRCLLSGKATWPEGYEWIWVDKVYGRRRRVPKLEARDIKRDRPYAEFLREAIRDKSSWVRHLAAGAMIRNRGQLRDEDPLIEHLAKDSSPAVRSCADYMLRHPLPPQS
jgi:hypothetical protein